MDKRLPLLTLCLASLVADGCRKVRQWRRPARLHHGAREVDPRQRFPTACWDPRYVTGSRIEGLESLSGDQVALATTTSGLAVVWKDSEGLHLRRGNASSLLHRTTQLRRFVLAAEGEGLWLTEELEGDVLLVRSLTYSGLYPAPEGWTEGRLAVTPTEVVLAARAGGRPVVQRLSHDLLPLGAPQFGAETSDAIDVASLNGNVAVFWTHNEGTTHTLRWSRLRAGALTPPSTLVARESPMGRVRVAAGGGRYAAAWSDADTGSVALMVATFSPSGTRGESIERLSARYLPTSSAELLWDGGAFGVTWSEPVGGGAPRAFAALVDRTGMRLGNAMRLQTETPTGLVGPALAWRTGRYALGFVRDDQTLDLREVGPRFCDPAIVAEALGGAAR